MLVRHRRFTFEFVTGPESVGMATGATIHTAHGLKVRVQRRILDASAAPEQQLEPSPALAA
jgi:hypothetical protein